MPSARSYSLSELVEATGFDRRTIVYYIQSGLLPKVGRRGPHTRYPDECLARLLFIKGVRGLQAGGQLLTATLAEMRRALAARDAAGIRDLLDRGLPVEELTALFADEGGEPGEPAPPAQVASPPAMPAPAATTAIAAAPTPVTGPSGERRSYGLADAGIRKRFGADKPAAPSTPEIHHDETHPGLPALDPATYQPPATGAPVSATGAGDSPPAEAELGDLLRELEVRPTMNARRSPPGSPEQWTEIPITSRVYLSVRGLAAEDAPLAEAVARLLKRALRARASPPSA
ncbi:MAG: MerR family transcriptional regulator [Gammaproteobacteria bacterium]